MSETAGKKRACRWAAVFAAVLCTLFLCLGRKAEAAVIPTDDIYGDVMGDGNVSVRDAFRTLQMTLNLIESPTEDMLTAADVDGDGEVTDADVLMIVQYCTGTVSYFPAKPFEASGTVWIIGDSIASDHDDNEYVRPIKGWGVYLPDYCTEDADIHNLARSGRSARSYLNETEYTTFLENMSWGDYLIFAMGNNDGTSGNLYSDPDEGSDVEGSFMWYVKTYYVDPALHEGLKVILIAPDSSFTGKEAYAEALHRLSEEYAEQGVEIPVIDITDLISTAWEESILENYGEDATDEEKTEAKALLYGIDNEGKANSHFSAYGADLIAKALAAEIKSLDLDLAKFIK